MRFVLRVGWMSMSLLPYSRNKPMAMSSPFALHTPTFSKTPLKPLWKPALTAANPGGLVIVNT